MSKKIFAIFLVASFLLALFVPQHIARAEGSSTIETVAVCASGAVTGPYGWITCGISVIGKFISWAAQGFAAVIQPKFQTALLNLEVVHTAWGIMRNFVNMFFILFLIIMAFGTIFDNAKYSYKSLLRPFLLAAIFINFSFPLTMYVISLANGLAAILLKTIGTADISTRLMNGLGLVGVLGTIRDQLLAIVLGPFSILMIVKATIILALELGAFGALISAFIFSVIRIPALWFILIMSPLAVGCSVLPNFRGSWESWRKSLIGWSFFLPIYLFFLMFAIMFINAKQTPAVTSLGGFFSQAFTNLFDFSDLLFYVVTMIFLVYGLKQAMSIGNSLDAHAAKAMGWAQDRVKRIGGRYSYNAVEGAAKQTWERVKEEGVPGQAGQFLYGGTRAERQNTTRLGDRLQGALGFRQTFAAQKDFLTSSNKEYDNVKQEYDLGRIDIQGIKDGVARHNANTAAGYAYRKMLGEVGQLDNRTATETLTALNNNPYAAVDFVKNSAEKGKLSALSPDQVRGLAGNNNINVSARKQLYKHIQANAGVAAGLGQPQFNEAMSLFGENTTAEGSAFLKDIGKIRPDLVAGYITAVGAPAERNPSGSTRETIIKGYMINAKDIGNMPLAVWELTIGGAPARHTEFERILWDKLNVGSEQKKKNFQANLEDAIQENGRDDAAKLAIVARLAAPGSIRPV